LVLLIRLLQELKSDLLARLRLGSFLAPRGRRGQRNFVRVA